MASIKRRSQPCPRSAGLHQPLYRDLQKGSGLFCSCCEMRAKEQPGSGAQGKVEAEPAKGKGGKAKGK